MSARWPVVLVGFALGALALPVVAADSQEASDDLNALVAAERGFAATSVESGMRTAFLTWLGEGSVVFRPQPVDGRSYFEASPEAPGALLWGPAFAEISPAGDMGWTTGPFEFRPDDTALPSSFGHYVSVWGRRPDGSWRVLVDHGSPHPQTEPADGVGFPAHNRRDAIRRNQRADTGVSVEALLAADLEFARAAERTNVRRAYRAVAADDVRLYRPGSQPVVGSRSLPSVFGRRPAMIGWTPERAGASVSGTLGYTFGRVRYDGKEVPEAYLRIWRREGIRWKLVVDVLPAPPPDPAAANE